MASPSLTTRMSSIEERLVYLEQREGANTREILRLKTDNSNLQNKVFRLKSQATEAKREKTAVTDRLAKLQAETKDTVSKLSEEVFALRGLQRMMNRAVVARDEGGLEEEVNGLKEKVRSLDATTGSTSDKVDALEVRQVKTNKLLEDLDFRQDKMDISYGFVDNDLKELEAEVKVIRDNVKGNGDSLKAAQDNIVKNQNRLKTVEDRLEKNGDRLTVSEGNIMKNTDRLKTVEDTLKSNEDRLKVSEGNIMKNTDRLKAAEDDIKRKVNETGSAFGSGFGGGGKMSTSSSSTAFGGGGKMSTSSSSTGFVFSLPPTTSGNNNNGSGNEVASLFGGFGGLGAKPSEEKASTNVFGSPQTFSSPTMQQGMFGTSSSGGGGMFGGSGTTVSPGGAAGNAKGVFFTVGAGVPSTKSSSTNNASGGFGSGPAPSLVGGSSSGGGVSKPGFGAPSLVGAPFLIGGVSVSGTKTGSSDTLASSGNTGGVSSGFGAGSSVSVSTGSIAPSSVLSSRQLPQSTPGASGGSGSPQSVCGNQPPTSKDNSQDGDDDQEEEDTDDDEYDDDDDNDDDHNNDDDNDDKKQQSRFDVVLTSWNPHPPRLQTGRAVPIKGYNYVVTPSGSMDCASGRYTTPWAGRFKFGVYGEQRGDGSVDWVLCRDDGTREVLVTTTVGDGCWCRGSVEWECGGGVSVWLEAVRKSGNAEVLTCVFDGEWLS